MSLNWDCDILSAGGADATPPPTKNDSPLNPSWRPRTLLRLRSARQAERIAWSLHEHPMTATGKYAYFVKP